MKLLTKQFAPPLFTSNLVHAIINLLQAARPSFLPMYYRRVPAANVPGCTAAEGLLYKPWSLVVHNCTARCIHQRPK